MPLKREKVCRSIPARRRMMAGMRRTAAIKYFHGFGIFEKRFTLAANRPSASAPDGLTVQNRRKPCRNKNVSSGNQDGRDMRVSDRGCARPEGGNNPLWLTLTSRGSEKIWHEGQQANILSGPRGTTMSIRGGRA